MILKREKINCGPRGGGSVKIGSIGTISSLMSRELESSSSSSRRNPQSAPVSVCCGDKIGFLRQDLRRIIEKKPKKGEISFFERWVEIFGPNDNVKISDVIDKMIDAKGEGPDLVICFLVLFYSLLVESNQNYDHDV